MSKKRVDPESPLFGCLSLVVILIILLLAFGCESQKHINKSEVNTDSIALSNANKKIQELTNEYSNSQQRIRELEHLEVTFTQPPPCPTVDVDSLKLALLASGCRQETVDSAIAAYNEVSKRYKDAEATIRKMADGSLTITGRIATLKQSKERLEETLRQSQHMVQFLTEENQQLQVELRKKQEVKVKDVKRSFLTQWWLMLIVGIIIGAFGMYRIHQWSIKHER